MNSVDKTLNCILPTGTLTCPYFEYVNTLFGSLCNESGQRKSTDNVTEVNCDDAKVTSK